MVSASLRRLCALKMALEYRLTVLIMQDTHGFLALLNKPYVNAEVESLWQTCISRQGWIFCHIQAGNAI